MLKLIIIFSIFSVVFSGSPFKKFQYESGNKNDNFYKLDTPKGILHQSFKAPQLYDHKHPEICGKVGCIRGKFESGRLKPYEAFYGIPYAEPPVGQLRFENPIPYRGWKGYWDATFPRSNCAQRHVFIHTRPILGSEDCLYLNIYRPKREYHKNLPVMVWIHGGSLTSSSSNPDEFGPEYLMDNGEVILVTLNYRLGIFGFLCSGDKAVKGNFGLKDQQLALKWVASNIEAFGGDPNSVTLFGESAGALSTNLHMMNPVSQTLFHRVILMSGTAISPWSFSYDWKLKFRLSAKYSGLEGWDTASSYELANQLKKLEPIRLILALDQLFTLIFTPPTPLRPCIEGDWEGAFLKEDPRKIWAEGRFKQKPILIGTTTDEGIIASPIPTNRTRLNLFNENIYEFLPIQLDFDPKYVKDVLGYYLGKDYVDKSNVEAYYKMFGDRTMRYPLIKLVNQYLKYADIKQNPVYIYEFGFRSQYTILQILTGMNINLGVSHIDDLIYVFTMPAFFPIIDANTPEGLMVDTFVKTLVNFATRGEVKVWAPFEVCTSYTNTPFCDRQIFERFNKTKPDSVIVSISDQINSEMVKLWDYVDGV